jgi:hypothetical protein
VAAEERTVVKRVKFGVLYSDGTIRVENVRASYPHLLEPYAGEDEDGKKQEAAYGIVGLLPKKTHVAVKDLCKARIDEILREKKVKAIPADKKFLRDGDLAAKAEFEGMFSISAREKRAPRLLVPSKQKVQIGSRVSIGGRERKSEEVFYGGCWVNILIRPWWQDNRFGKRVNAGLVAVQFLRDDEAFGEGRITDDQIEDSFESLEDDESSGFEDGEEDNGGL